MDRPNDPRSHGGESHNGPAAEVEPAHAEQESSQFQTPGTVNSRRGTQTGLPSSPASTVLRNLANPAEELKNDESSVTLIEHTKRCIDIRAEIFSVMELKFLKKKPKDALESYGSLPKPDLDADTLELLNKTDAEISSDDLANAVLDISGAKQLVFQLATLALQQMTEANAKSIARRQSMALQAAKPTKLGQSRPDTVPTTVQDKVLLSIPVAGSKLEDAVKLAVVNYLSNPTEDGSNLILNQFNTLSMGGKLEITTVGCPIEYLHDKSGKFAALGKPKTDSAASSVGEYSGTYTIIASSEDHISNDSDQQQASAERKWSYVIADQTEFEKKIEDVKRSAISEDLVGRKIVEQDDGVIVAVYELPAETHVGFVIRSRVSQALASQIINSAEDILNAMHLTDDQRLQFRQICLKYSPYTNASNPRGYHVPSLTQEVTVKSVIVNCAYSNCNLYQNLVDELANSLHRYSTANHFNTLAEFFKHIVLMDKDILEHRLVVIEEQRRQLVKTMRWGEVPSEFWDQAGIQQRDGVPLCIATPQFMQHALLQQALERKIDGGGNAKFQQALTFAIESTTGKPPADKKNPLQNLSAPQLAKVATLVSASVDNYGLNCNAPGAVPRDYSGSTIALPMPRSGANAFGAHGVNRLALSGGYDQPRG